ncbi:MAG: indolepyruvate oxidoreductase subunit beta [Candidatus Sumerlaeota bacterium]|nr:indolepyruvate oxidoreductase subunit beta [Candidatus Sumerlaeota bacterium]
MNDTRNILLVGVGGQGIILASDILTQAALNAGFDAKKSEIHGMSQRGGSVFSHVRFGARVFSPVIPEGTADLLVALEEMEGLRWLRYCGPQTELIIMKLRINPANVQAYPDGVEDELRRLFGNARTIDPAQLIEQCGGKKFINTAVLGVVATRLGFPEKAWRDAVDKLSPAGTADLNWRAFEAGRRYR